MSDRSSRHPLIEAAQALAPEIRAAAERIEREQTIPAAIIEGLRRAGFFRADLPKAYGGDELEPLVIFEALERLARADASTAWVALIISANPHLLGNALADHVWREMFRDPDTATAGNLAPNGRAWAVDGGYRIAGHWKYGSGSAYCRYLVSGCVLYEGEQPSLGADGEPELRWAIHRTSDCKLLSDSWNTTGLRGTGSYDYVIEELFVPADWTFRVGDTRYPQPIPAYAFPALPFAGLGAIALGMAREAIESVKGLGERKRRGFRILMKEDPAVQIRIGEAEARVGAARSYLVDTLRDLQRTFGQGGGLSAEQRAHFRLALTHGVRSAVETVDRMYALAGGPAIQHGGVLDRILRDVHTASTQIQVNESTYLKAGRLLLGLDPEDPMF